MEPDGTPTICYQRTYVVGELSWEWSVECARVAAPDGVDSDCGGADGPG